MVEPQCPQLMSSTLQVLIRSFSDCDQIEIRPLPTGSSRSPDASGIDDHENTRLNWLEPEDVPRWREVQKSLPVGEAWEQTRHGVTSSGPFG